MKARVLLIVMAITLNFGYSQNSFDEPKFFAAIASEDLSLVDGQLKTLKKSSIKEKDAYVGALLMKKAGLVSPLRTKLAVFKEGHAKLQAAIEKEPANGIYRFLRLIIQENAPKILNYNKDISEDSKYVNQVFDTLSPAVQNVVVDYEKKSKALRIDKIAKCEPAKTSKT